MNTHNFELLSQSYQCADKERSSQILNAAPTAILGLVVRLQSNYKGFMFRSRYSSRMKIIALYCKDINWPQQMGEEEEDENADDYEKFQKKAAKKKDGDKTLDEKIATFKPQVSQYLGGQGLDQEQKLKELKRPGGDAPSSPAKTR